MDIVDGLELPKWRTFVDRLHAQGKLFFAEMRPLTHLGKMFEYVMNDPGLQDAVCLDFNLNPIKINCDYDVQQNQAAPQKDVRVRLGSFVAGGSRVTKVIYHTSGRAPQSLDFTVQNDGIRVLVPELELWGILQIEAERITQ